MKTKLKLTIDSLGAIVTPLVSVLTVIACGSKSEDGPRIVPSAEPTKSVSVEYKNIPMTEYDVERNILNTEEYGLLPLTRILHTLESKDQGGNEYNQDLIQIGRATQDVGNKVYTLVKDVDKKDVNLQELSKIYIDNSIQVNGRNQSLDNPIKTFTITKKEILEKGNIFSDIAKQINEFLQQNKNVKYSVLTEDLIEDEIDANDVFSTGSYVVNLYQKPSNSTDLDKIIALLKDPSKFGSSQFALEMMDGFCLGTVWPYVGNWNNSLFSNYFTKERVKYTADKPGDTPKYYKNGVQPKIFDPKRDLLDSVYTNDFDEHFDKTEPASGMANIQVASKNMSDDEFDYWLKHSIQNGNLIIDKKTNSIALELTVTATPDASISVFQDKSEDKDMKSNYEKSSVETIYIDLPQHTSWVSGSAASVMDELFDNVKSKVNTPSVYEAFTNLFSKTQQKIFGLDPLQVQSLFGPHLKQILIDDANWFEEAAKYVDLLNDKEAFTNFIEWAEKNNPAFSAATLNLVIKNFEGVPEILGTELNSSKLYTFFAYQQIFYRQLDRFMSSNEGKKYESLLNTKSAREQLKIENTKIYTEELSKLKANFDGKSFDLNRMLPETAKDSKTVLSAIKFPADTVNLKAEVTKIDIDSIKGTGKAEITLTPLKLKNQTSEVIKLDLANIIKDSEIIAKQNELATLINPIKLTSTQFKIAPAKEFLSSILNPNLKFNFGMSGSKYSVKEVANDVEISSDYLKIIIGEDEFNKLDLTTLAPTGTEFMFKAQNVDVANGKFELVVGLRDVVTKIANYGSTTIGISKP